MPAKSFMTSSQIIETVKRRAFLPNTQLSLDDNDILAFVNEELNDSVIPLIMTMHEEYFLYPEDFPILPNVQNYQIPYRAIGRKLRDVKFLDTNNNVYVMTRIDPADRSFFQRSGSNQFRSFYLQGDDIVLTTTVGDSPTGSIEMLYYFKPNKLVEETRVAYVSSINTVTGEVFLSSLPTNLTALSQIDFLQSNPGNKTYAYDVPILSTNSLNVSITVDPDLLPSLLQVGDIIASAGECIIPQIPVEMHSILAERVAARCLASLGDAAGVQISNSKIAEMEVKVGALIGNRDEGNPRKINNLGSILRQSKISRRRFFT